VRTTKIEAKYETEFKGRSNLRASAGTKHEVKNRAEGQSWVQS